MSSGLLISGNQFNMVAKIGKKHFSHGFIDMCFKFSFPDAFYAKNVMNGLANFCFMNQRKARFPPNLAGSFVR